MHRVFAVFIWCSVWERTSRTNLFRSLKAGGLGLSHLFVRQLVSRFIFLRDQKDPFLRTIIQVRLSRAIPSFVVSSSEDYSVCVRGFLKEVVGAYCFLVTRFSLEYLSEVSRKRLTTDLIDVLFPIPMYRFLYSAGPGQDVLKRVKRMLVPPNVKTFFFKLHSQTLPVKAWLVEKGLPVAWSDNCILCKKQETVEHVFLDCWDAVFFWDVLQRTLKKDLPLTPHGIRYLAVEDENGVPFDMLLLLGLHSIWRCRMAVRHADVDVRPVYKYYVEHMCFLKEMFKPLQPPPEWLPLLDGLSALKDF
uniref:Putative tick transposon n=1 Tax=Ixodes scapularis TaxID=6945 RepID=A0A4D5RJL9_IXOSC